MEKVRTYTSVFHLDSVLKKKWEIIMERRKMYLKTKQKSRQIILVLFQIFQIILSFYLIVYIPHSFIYSFMQGLGQKC